MGKHLDAIAPIVLGALGSVVPGLGTGVGAALGAGLGSAGVNYSHNHSLGRALEAGALGGGGTYLGSNIASNLIGDKLGTVGSTLGIEPGASSSGLPGAWDAATANAADATAGNANLPWLSGAGSSNIASSLGSTAGSMVSNTLSQPISGVVGGYAGNSLASGFQPPNANSLRGMYEPTMASTSGMPASLNSMASLTPQQQSSSLATQGAYGGGLGPQEQGYFKNLVNNEIVGGGSPNAIENSYLSKLGFGNEGSNYNLAKALSQWNPTA